MSPQKEKKQLPNLLTYAHLGIKMVTVMGASAWLGMKIDSQLQLAAPWGLCIFSLGSTIYMLWATIRSLV